MWVRKKWAEKNALEREIAGYDTVIFPPRPRYLDEEYKRKERERIERRKMQRKLQRLALLEKGTSNIKFRKSRSTINKSENEDADESDNEDRVVDQGDNDIASRLESEKDEVGKAKARTKPKTGKKTKSDPNEEADFY